jgi:hypothetical protein
VLSACGLFFGVQVHPQQVGKLKRLDSELAGQSFETMAAKAGAGILGGIHRRGLLFDACLDPFQEPLDRYSPWTDLVRSSREPRALVFRTTCRSTSFLFSFFGLPACFVPGQQIKLLFVLHLRDPENEVCPRSNGSGCAPSCTIFAVGPRV